MEGISIINGIKKYSLRTKSMVSYLNRTNPNIVVFIVYGLLYDTVFNMYKPFAVKFLERLGGNELDISLYNALPGLVAALVLLPGSYFISRQRTKKNITSVFFMISRTIILFLAFIPFLPKSMGPIVFVLLLSIMNFPEALAQTSLQNFLGSVFNGSVRAEAIALRNKFGNVVVLLVTMVTGLVLTFIPRTDEQRIICYQIFFVLAFLIGMVEIFVFRKFQEEEPRDDFKKTEIRVVKKVLNDKNFLRFMATSLLFQFTWQAGWPLSSIYQIKYLLADEIWLALFAVSSGIASFFTAGYWTKMISKRGNQRTLLTATLFMAVNMIFMASAPNLIFMTLACGFGGFANIGVNTSLLNGLLGSTPDQDRIVYIGTYNTFVNVSLFLSPLVAFALLDRFQIFGAMMIVCGGRFISCFVIFMEYRRSIRKNSLPI